MILSINMLTLCKKLKVYISNFIGIILVKDHLFLFAYFIQFRKRDNYTKQAFFARIHQNHKNPDYVTSGK